MPHILVVEDEVVVRIALREELQDRGVTVVETNDAESALECLQAGHFDAAIIDIALPGMRGDVFAKECRRRFPSMALLLATGMHASDIRALFEDDPRLEVLEKPHDFDAVRECLERLGLKFDDESR